MSESLAIETNNLNYAFSKYHKAVNNLSLKVPEGSIFGFLGPNGAGKTTTMRMLTGTLPSEKDNIFVRGKSLKQSMPKIFEDIGTLVETPSLYLHLSGYDNLRIICILRGLKFDKINPVLELVDLLRDGKRKAKEYSLGMKQRLGIAMALLSNPKLLLLDEPVNGLDPAGIVEVRELLKKLNREQNITIFISSHLLNEIEKTCTHVSIIHKGILQYQGSLNELQQSENLLNEVTFTFDDAIGIAPIIQQKFQSAKAINRKSIIFNFENETEIPEINKWLVENDINVLGINTKLGLEDWFMKVTSK